MAANENPLVIAIDSSTTATKAIIVDTSGKVLALGKEDIDLKSPQQGLKSVRARGTHPVFLVFFAS